MTAHGERSERLALLGLLAAMAISAVTLLLLSDGFRFWSDELTWLTHGDDFEPRTLLTPYNSHLIAIPYVLYEAGPRLFGLEYLPFRIVGVLGALGVAGAVFALVRSRVGGPVALAPAVVLLFFGAASEVVVTPLGIPFSLSIGLGLSALLALERDHRGTDLAAGLLLIASILSHTFGTIFAFGSLVYLLASRAPRRRLLVPLVPLALWVAWFLWARQFDQGITDLSNVLSAPAFMVETAGTSLAAILGVSRNVEGLQADIVAAVFIPLILVLAVLLAVHVRRRGASPWLIAYLATALAFWFGIALSESEARQPTTARYLYFGAIMLILIGAELARGRRPSRRIAFAIAAIAALCVSFNVVRLVLGSEDLRDKADEVGAQLAALELAGGIPPDDFQPAEAGGPGSDGIIARAEPLREFVDEHGSLGMSDAELAAQPDELREGADYVLARALGLYGLPSPAPPRDCREVADPSRFGLPAGASILIPTVSENLRLGHFADEATAVAGVLVAGEPLTIALPPGEAGRGWFATAGGPIELCAVAAPPD